MLPIAGASTMMKSSMPLNTMKGSGLHNAPPGFQKMSSGEAAKTLSENKHLADVAYSGSGSNKSSNESIGIKDLAALANDSNQPMKLRQAAAKLYSDQPARNVLNGGSKGGDSISFAELAKNLSKLPGANAAGPASSAAPANAASPAASKPADSSPASGKGGPEGGGGKQDFMQTIMQMMMQMMMMMMKLMGGGAGGAGGSGGAGGAAGAAGGAGGAAGNTIESAGATKL